jgi:parallel beta-helix repeat protein
MKNHSLVRNKKIKYHLKIISFLVILMLIFTVNNLVLCKQVNADLIYVDGSAIVGYSTIQEGIDAAISGDTIYVCNGTYFENIVIDKPISLIGEDSSNTIIDGRGAGNTIKVNADYVKIKGFTIQHSGLIYPSSGINLSSDYNVVENNIIMNNFYGMTMYHSSYNTIQNNTIQNDDHCGIYMSASTNNSILNNIIQNHNYNGVGVYDSSDANLIMNNEFSSNNFCGVNIRISADNNIIGNNFTGNNIGIHIPDSSNTVNSNNFSGNNVDIDLESILSNTEFLLIIGIVIFFIILGLTFYIARVKKIK